MVPSHMETSAIVAAMAPYEVNSYMEWSPIYSGLWSQVLNSGWHHVKQAKSFMKTVAYMKPSPTGLTGNTSHLGPTTL